MLAAAPSLLKIPVRNMAKMVWITGSTEKVVDCEELSEIESAMLDIWMEKTE
jgi:hypothetical protein